MIQVGQLQPGNRRRDLERALDQRQDRTDDHRRPDARADAEQRLQCPGSMMHETKRRGAEQIQHAHGHARLDQVRALADILREINRRESREQADEQKDEIPLNQQRRQHAHLHHGEKPDPRAQQQRDEKRRERARAEKIKLRQPTRVFVRGPVEVKPLHHDEVEPDRAENQHQPRVGTPHLRAIELQQHQPRDEHDEREDLVLQQIFHRMRPRHADMQQRDEEAEHEQPQLPAPVRAALQAVLGMRLARLITRQTLADQAAAFEPVGEHRRVIIA